MTSANNGMERDSLSLAPHPNVSSLKHRNASVQPSAGSNNETTEDTESAEKKKKINITHDNWSQTTRV